MAEVHGSCADRFNAVREALARNLDGDELPASVAVDLDGGTVVDLWGGYRDLDRTARWTQDTIVNGWSMTTRCVLSLAALMLVDRGELDVEVRHMPEGRTVHWGGSMIVMDLDRRLTKSYRMAPGMLGSARAESYIRAGYDAVGST